MGDWVNRIASEPDQVHHRPTVARPQVRAPILVTGASGFVGAALSRALLASGNRVRLMSRRDPPGDILAHSSAVPMHGDLGDPDTVEAAMQGVETVFHAGATMGGSCAEYERGTVTGTKNMVDAAVRNGIRKFIHVSSMSVIDYASLAAGAAVDESARCEPAPSARGPYTSSKLEAERIVLKAARAGLPAVVLRPGQIFGPGREAVPPFGTVSAAARIIVMGPGRMKLPLVYVDDVVDALLRAADVQLEPGCILQLVDSDTITQREYLAYMREKFPRLKIHYAPFAVLYPAAVAIEIVGKLLRCRVPLSTYRLRSLRGDLCFDCKRARDCLGWTPRVGVRDGLRRTFRDRDQHAAQTV